MKTPVTFPAETNTIPESPGLTVESAFVNEGVKRSNEGQTPISLAKLPYHTDTYGT